jgi:hypothetical protein
VGVKVLIALLLLVAIAGLLVYRSDRVGYWWASYRDTPEAYQAFLDRSPSSKWATEARLQRDLALEGKIWAEAEADNLISGYRRYIERYQRVPPAMRHRVRVDEAQERLSERIESLWANGKPWASVDEIERFLRDYPEKNRSGEVAATIQRLRDDDAWTSAAVSNEYDSYVRYLTRFRHGRHHREAEQAIERFESDWEWVKARDELEVYRRFLARFPGHQARAAIERRIIDLESKIWPPAVPVFKGKGGDKVTIVIKNDTDYVLTVSFIGPTSVHESIPARGEHRVTLNPGRYTRTASLPSSLKFGESLWPYGKAGEIVRKASYGPGRYRLYYYVMRSGIGQDGVDRSSPRHPLEPPPSIKSTAYLYLREADSESGTPSLWAPDWGGSSPPRRPIGLPR